MTRTAKLLLNVLILTAVFSGLLSLLVASKLAVALAVLAVTVLASLVYLISAPLMVYLSRALPLPRLGYEALYDTLEHDAEKMGLGRVPAVYYTKSEAFNAFAVGHSANGAIILSAGLLNNLGLDEARAVVAHEMAHIVNHDNALMVLNAVTVGAIRLVAWALFFIVFLAAAAVDVALGLNGGMAAGKTTRMGAGLGNTVRRLMEFLIGLVTMALMAVSRENEYRADRAGAEVVSPVAMAGALMTMERVNSSRPIAGLMDGLYRSHPGTKDRLANLRKKGAL